MLSSKELMIHMIHKSVSGFTVLVFTSTRTEDKNFGNKLLSKYGNLKLPVISVKLKTLSTLLTALFTLDRRN